MTYPGLLHVSNVRMAILTAVNTTIWSPLLPFCSPSQIFITESPEISHFATWAEGLVFLITRQRKERDYNSMVRDVRGLCPGCCGEQGTGSGWDTVGGLEAHQRRNDPSRVGSLRDSGPSALAAVNLAKAARAICQGPWREMWRNWYSILEATGNKLEEFQSGCHQITLLIAGTWLK